MTSRVSPGRAAAILWIAVTACCGVYAVLKPHSHTVYPVYTYAAEEWIVGRNLYVEVPGYDYYRYSPTLAAFFVPWRWLGDAWGGAIWRILGMATLAAGLGKWTRISNWQVTSPNHIGWLYLLIVPFLLQNVHNGQSNPHILGMLLLATAEATEGRPWRSAAWFAAAALIKPYHLAIAALVALVDRRIIPRLAVALIIGLGVAFLFQSPTYVAGQYANWFRHLISDNRGELELRNAYRDVALLFRYYFHALPPVVYQAMTAAIGLGLAALVWRGTKSMTPRHEQFGRAFALGCCWVTTLGPATESCTYVILAPALAMALLSRTGTSSLWTRVSYGLFVGTIAAALLPREWRVQVLGPQPIAGLIFLATVISESIASLRKSKHCHNVGRIAA